MGDLVHSESACSTSMKTGVQASGSIEKIWLWGKWLQPQHWRGWEILEAHLSTYSELQAKWETLSQEEGEQLEKWRLNLTSVLNVHVQANLHTSTHAHTHMHARVHTHAYTFTYEGRRSTQCCIPCLSPSCRSLLPSRCLPQDNWQEEGLQSYGVVATAALWKLLSAEAFVNGCRLMRQSRSFYIIEEFGTNKL